MVTLMQLKFHWRLYSVCPNPITELRQCKTLQPFHYDTEFTPLNVDGVTDVMNASYTHTATYQISSSVSHAILQIRLGHFEEHARIMSSFGFLKHVLWFIPQPSTSLLIPSDASIRLLPVSLLCTEHRDDGPPKWLLKILNIRNES